MSHRRGQMEILGLAIIVVIVIFVILIFFWLMPHTDQNNLQSDVADSTIASNLLIVIPETSLLCKDISLKDLLHDCAHEINKEYCTQNVVEDPCRLVEKIIKEKILDQTLGAWKKNYTFRADVGTENRILITNTLTTANKPACALPLDPRRFSSLTSESAELAIGSESMEISLNICR